VGAIYAGTPQQRVFSNQLLTEIKDNPESWRRCEEILLSPDTSLNTKFFALSIYDGATASRWMELPREQILNTVLELIKSVSARAQTDEKPLLRKLDKVFVNAVKNEWLGGSEMWKSVIPQLASMAGNDQNMWENTMTILNMLSEDIFDFGSSSMTSKKVAALKHTLSEQFPHVQRLVELILTQYIQSPPNTLKNSLINAALSTMSHYLKWVPPSVLFTSNIIDVIISNFWEPIPFRIETVKCLSEVFSVSVNPDEFSGPEGLALMGGYQQRMGSWVSMVAEKLTLLPRHIVIDGKSPASNERLFYETLFNQLSIMCSALVKKNVFVLLNFNLAQSVQLTTILVRLTAIAGDEGFKSFVLMWQTYTEYFVSGVRAMGRSSSSVDPDDILSMYKTTSTDQTPTGFVPSPQIISASHAVLGDLARTLILRMAQPPEVTISENEDGEITRADAKETAEIDLYNSMAKCLQNITFVDRGLVEPTLLAMLKELAQSVRVSGPDWPAGLLSRITWAAGSIAGVTPSPESEAEEKKFTFEIIRELLGLCNLHNTRTNRAIVASAVLFYCARHHRFLRSNHKFLRTVFKKLFEFMAETTPGVKEMASDTFLVISRSCAHKLVETVVENNSSYAPFIDSLVGEIHPFLTPLEPLQKCTIFEAIGLMICAVKNDKTRQENLFAGFLAPFTQRWIQILASANENHTTLFDLGVLRDLSLILRLLERMCFGLNTGVVAEKYIVQIYEDILRLYKVYSETITATAANTPNMTGWENIKLMKKVKGDCLRLVATFINTGPSSETTHQIIIPRLLEYVLEDYQGNQSRDPEVLRLLSVLTLKTSSIITQDMVGVMFAKVFFPTREMLVSDPRAWPDHRSSLLTLMKDLSGTCFGALMGFLLQSDQLGVLLETLVEGIQNESPMVADLALGALSGFLENLATTPTMTDETKRMIYGKIFGPLVTVIMTVLTDKLHDSGKEVQIKILMHLLRVNGGEGEAFVNGVISSVGPTIPLNHRDAFTRSLFDNTNNIEIFRQLMNDLKITVSYGGYLDI
jgi:exportin-1